MGKHPPPHALSLWGSPLHARCPGRLAWTAAKAHGPRAPGLPLYGRPLPWAAALRSPAVFCHPPSHTRPSLSAHPRCFVTRRDTHAPRLALTRGVQSPAPLRL